MEPNQMPWNTPSNQSPQQSAGPDGVSLPRPEFNNSGQPANFPAPEPWQPPQQPSYQAAPEAPAYTTQPVWTPPQPQQFIEPANNYSQPSWSLPSQEPTPVPQQPSQQFGGHMAELPPILSQSTTPAPRSSEHKHRRMWLLLPLIILLVSAALIGAFLLVLKINSHPKTTAKTITAASHQLTAIGKKPLTDASLKGLDSTSAFYAVFQNASQQKSVQNNLDVYYTKNPDDKRPKQYDLYRTAIDYSTKDFAFSQDTYGSLSALRTRCIAGVQYNYQADAAGKLTWQKNSDSTSCTLDAVKSYLNDGLNTGGLTKRQASTFIDSLVTSKAIKVGDATIVKNGSKKYLRFDVTITPQKQSKDLYLGMQLLMNAFDATGQKAATYPYSYYGAGSQGMHIAYYVDASTQLPAYAQMITTPSYNKAGKAEVMQNYTHRIVEYIFNPVAINSVTASNLDDDTISFLSWPAN